MTKIKQKSFFLAIIPFHLLFCYGYRYKKSPNKPMCWGISTIYSKNLKTDFLMLVY